MSATGLDVFDKTLQTTNIWLDQIMQDVGPDRKTAWRVLAVVLHRLRNRLPLGLAVNLGAQLPILVRGLYYDQFEPAKQPSECDTMEKFCGEVAEWLQDNRPVDPETAIKSVFRVLDEHVSPGEIAKVVQALPKELRQAWPESSRSGVNDQAQSSADQSGSDRPGSSGGQGDSPLIGRGSDSSGQHQRQQRESDLEPASPNAKQNMTGGTSGEGPAR
jgi:uncharacterized protein (DUF2267 family)